MYLQEQLLLEAQLRAQMSVSSTADPRGLLTSLGSGREETNLDFLLAELVSKPGDGFPGAAADGVPVRIKVINKVDLASSVNSDLVAGANAQTRAVVRAKVHETFASRRISLLINGTWDGKLGREALRCREKVRIGDTAEDRLVDVDGRGLSSRGNVRTSRGRDTVLDVGPRNGVGVVRLDVEHDGDDVKLEPEPGAEVGCLDR